MLQLVDAVSDAGRKGRANEDGCGVAGRVAWVIDGATGLGEERLLPGPSDAAWLTATMDAFFRKAALEESDPGRLLAMAADDAERHYRAERLRPPMENYEIPTAAVLVAAFYDERVEIAELGDCGIFLRAGGALCRFGGSEEGRALETANAQRMMAGGKGRDGKVIDFLRGIRNLANTPAGYAIFAPDRLSTQRARRFTHPCAAPCEALLVSDGYEAAIEDYGLYDAPGLLDVAARDIKEPLRALRQVERDDPDCTAFPRFKPSDDATAMMVRYDAVQ